MRRLLPLCSLLLASPAIAQEWLVDHAQSTLTFTGSQAGDPFTGEFTRFHPEIDFDPAKPEMGHIRVTIDMSSARLSDKQQNDALPTADWFATETYPQAVFESQKIRTVSTQGYEAKGTLTLRGISQPVILPFTLTPQGESMRAEGETMLMRNQFGLGGSQWADDRWVAYPVTVNFSLLAQPKP